MLLISLHDKLKILKKDIRNLTRDQIKEFFLDQGMKAYVSSQVYSWIWKKFSTSFDEMSNLSIQNRKKFNGKIIMRIYILR